MGCCVFLILTFIRNEKIEITRLLIWEKVKKITVIWVAVETWSKEKKLFIIDFTWWSDILLRLLIIKDGENEKENRWKQVNQLITVQLDEFFLGVGGRSNYVNELLEMAKHVIRGLAGDWLWIMVIIDDHQSDSEWKQEYEMRADSKWSPKCHWCCGMSLTDCHDSEQSRADKLKCLTSLNQIVN